MHIRRGLDKSDYISTICGLIRPFCKRHRISCTVTFLDAETIFLDFSASDFDRVNETLDFGGLIEHRATWKKLKKYIIAFLKLSYNI